MPERTNVIFSPRELDFARDESIILTKSSVIRKVIELYVGLKPTLEALMADNNTLLPPEVLKSNQKISRGENYKGMPWVMMDYPAYFHKSGVFALRNFFWWGHYFSTTLHISGKFVEHYEYIVASANSFSNMHLQLFGDEWSHDLHQNKLEEPTNNAFIKVSIMHAIEPMDKLEKNLKTGFEQIFSVLKP